MVLDPAPQNFLILFKILHPLRHDPDPGIQPVILREIIHQLILPVDAPGQLPCPAVPGVAAETVQKRRLQTEGNIQRQRPFIPRHRRIRTGLQPVPDLLLLHIRQHRRDRRNVIDRFLQLIPGAQVEMILRHHVRGPG